MSRRTRWLVAAFLFVAGDGMAMQVRGALLSSFADSFRVSESLLGLVAPAGTLGFVLAILVVGLAAGRLDARRTFVAGAVLTVASLAAIAVAPLYAALLAALLVQGAAAGVFRAVDRPLLSHLYPDRVGRVFVLYALAWALGAVSGPLLASAVLSVADWRVTYLLAAAWFLPVVALVWGTEPPEWEERELDRATLRRLVERPAIRGTLLAMGLLGGIEGAIFTWLPYYAEGFLERELANAALSTYLLAYVPGRYVYARVVSTTAYLRLSLATTALAIPTLALALGGTTGLEMLAAVFGAGLLLSSLFPMLSAYGVESAPAYSGPVSALTTAATYLGIAVVPTVIGVVAEAIGIERAMWIPVGLAAVLAVVIAATRTRSRDAGGGGADAGA